MKPVETILSATDFSTTAGVRACERAVLGLSWISIGLFLLYLLNTGFLYRYGH